MQWHDLDSRALRAAHYDEASGTLRVRFASGRIYRYDGVPREVFEWLMRVPSKGGFFNRMIKDGYVFVEEDGEGTEEADLESALRASLREGEGGPGSR